MKMGTSLASARLKSVAMASTSKGSTMIAALPTVPGMAEVFVVTTGVPQAIASSGGRPKPS